MELFQRSHCHQPQRAHQLYALLLFLPIIPSSTLEVCVIVVISRKTTSVRNAVAQPSFLQAYASILRLRINDPPKTLSYDYYHPFIRLWLRSSPFSCLEPVFGNLACRIVTLSILFGPELALAKGKRPQVYKPLLILERHRRCALLSNSAFLSLMHQLQNPTREISSHNIINL